MDEMTIEQRQDPDVLGKQGLKLAGSVTIGQAAELKKALLNALNDASELQVDLSGVTEIDLAGLQLLCATHQSATVSGKRFTVSAGENRNYLNAVVNAGFKRPVGCGRDSSGTCIWMGEMHRWLS